jgi:hypothetical protein
MFEVVVRARGDGLVFGKSMPVCQKLKSPATFVANEAVFASKNISLSQPVPRGQRRVSADQSQVVFPSPRL